MSRVRTPFTALVVVLCLFSFHAAAAGPRSGWWDGSWSCSIDGRPARMKWVHIERGMNVCDERGRNCVASDRRYWRGGFSDQSSRWVDLSHPRVDGNGGVHFRHADGNEWYLGYPRGGGKATGWTTWQGQRYPLACWR